MHKQIQRHQRRDAKKHFKYQAQVLYNLEISQHAVERYALRKNTHRPDDEIRQMIRNDLQRARLIAINKREERYTRHGLIFCVTKTKNKNIVTTILLTKRGQIEKFSNRIDYIDYEAFDGKKAANS